MRYSDSYGGWQAITLRNKGAWLLLNNRWLQAAHHIEVTDKLTVLWPGWYAGGTWVAQCARQGSKWKEKVQVWSEDRGAEGVAYGEGVSPSQPIKGSGGASWAPPAGSGAIRGRAPAKNDFGAFWGR